MSKINFSKDFLKHFKKAPTKIQNEVTKRIELFKTDKFHPMLNNHALTGNYKGFRSINITGDWRVIYTDQNNVIVFELLGTHSQLYK